MKMKTKIGASPFIIMGLLLLLTNGCKKDEEPTDKITDKDGNVYTFVTIGTQVWMVENLQTTKLNDGTAIPNTTVGTEWRYLATPGYCWYNNDASTYKDTYGALYNWFAVNTGKLCPVGWHVPLESEWLALIAYSGGGDVAGGKLKESGTAHWTSPNDEATNETGFSAMPGGRRDPIQVFTNEDGAFEQFGNEGNWWSFLENDYYTGSIMHLFHTSGEVYVFTSSKKSGNSVRCLKD